MSYDRTIFLYRGFFYAVPVFFYLLLFPPLLYGDDEFSFDLGEIEKKALQTGGFLELRSTHMDINQGSVFSNLNLSDPDISTIDQILLFASVHQSN